MRPALGVDREGTGASLDRSRDRRTRQRDRAQSQQVSPRQASRPSLTATMAMTNAATGSAHAHPNSALAASPVRVDADKYVQSVVWVDSAIRVRLPIAAAVRRFAHASVGMTTSDTAVSTMPTVDASGSAPVTRSRIEVAVT